MSPAVRFNDLNSITIYHPFVFHVFSCRLCNAAPQEHSWPLMHLHIDNVDSGPGFVVLCLTCLSI